MALASGSLDTESDQTSWSLLDRALAPPTRTAPLVGLAVELRQPGVWVNICRHAAQRAPGWLEDRMRADDPLVAALGILGDPDDDPQAARAVVALALVLCGRRDEREPLSRCARLVGEPAPASLADLDPGRQPALCDLWRDLRAPRRGASKVATQTFGVGIAGQAVDAYAVATGLSGRAPGVRLDVAARLFAGPAPLLADAVEAVAAAARSSKRAVLVDVVDRNGLPTGGDACAAALLAASDAAAAGRELEEELLVVGALRGTTVVPPTSPGWLALRERLAQTDGARRLLAPEAVPGAPRATVVRNVAALRKLLARKRRRRRGGALAGAAVLVGVAIVASQAGSPTPGVDAERQASLAESLLAANPRAAAVHAARAVQGERTDATLHAAQHVLASAPLTQVTGRERGRLIAVAIDAAGTVTTVSNAGRATRWTLHEHGVTARRAVPVPRDMTLRALSHGGRWLVCQLGELSTEALLIDTAGLKPTRRIELEDGGADSPTPLAVSDGDRPAVAMARPTSGVRITGAPALPELHERVTALRFSPDGRMLALGATSGRSAVFVLRGRTWRVARPWRSDLDDRAIVDIDVDDSATTIATAASSPSLLVSRWRSTTAAGIPQYFGGDKPALGGGSLTLVSRPQSTVVRDNLANGTATAIEVASPRDAVTQLPLASAPALHRAVLAEPRGLFSVLDLRRVQSVPDGVVPGSVSLRGDRLAALSQDADERLLAWDLGTGERVHVSPQPRTGTGIIAQVSADGDTIVTSTSRGMVTVRDAVTGRTLQQLGAAGRRAWRTVAADRAARTVAAVEDATRSVTVWRRERDASGAWRAAVVFQSPSLPATAARTPPPLALTPDGRTLLYGTADEVRLRTLPDGRERRISTRAAGAVVRARFDARGSRLVLAGAEGLLELSGPGLQHRRALAAASSIDGVPLPGGLIAAATSRGLQLLSGHGAPELLAAGTSTDDALTGTLPAPPARLALVPHGVDAPLVVVPVPAIDVGRLCRLAGWLRATASGCGGGARLPAPRAAAGAAPAIADDSVLSANGLGPVRLGRRLPATVARRPGYGSDRCTVRFLDDHAVAIATRRDVVQAIALFPTDYVSDDALYEAGLSLRTDLGLMPGDVNAEDIYGRPWRATRDVARWRLRDSGGALRILRASRNYDERVPVSISVASGRCEPWR